MTPSLEHVQPLLLDLSQQGAPGKYLLTIQGVNSRRYLWVDETRHLFPGDSRVIAFYNDASGLVAAFPTATAWTLVKRELLEFPTLKALALQTKQDLTAQGQYQDELYPEAPKSEEGNGGSHEKPPLISTGFYL